MLMIFMAAAAAAAAAASDVTASINRYLAVLHVKYSLFTVHFDNYRCLATVNSSFKAPLTMSLPPPILLDENPTLKTECLSDCYRT